MLLFLSRVMFGTELSFVSKAFFNASIKRLKSVLNFLVYTCDMVEPSGKVTW